MIRRAFGPICTMHAIWPVIAANIWNICKISLLLKYNGGRCSFVAKTLQLPPQLNVQGAQLTEQVPPIHV